MDTDFFGGLLQEEVHSLKPYREVLERRRKLPAVGLAQEAVMHEIRHVSQAERDRWHGGKVSGAVYHGGPAHTDFLNQVYALQSQNNPLHADVWPSTSKFEAEI